ncbi:MAG: matrixin family metalloprotease [Chitinophagaceae bacterium]
MRFIHAFISVITVLVLPGCIKYKDNFFQEKNKNKIIALQPLDDYDTEQLNSISKEIGSFYNRSVIILKPVNIPLTVHIAPNVELYSADSILNMLANLLNDEIIEVVGLTTKNIYILKKNTDKTKGKFWSDNVSPVLGFGDYPGNCSVVSDYLFRTNDTTLLKHRLKSVIIHEIGHNLGLDHCTVEGCVMSEENRKIPVLDKGGNDYCNLCKRKLDH